jgi:hypothetical protein
MEIFPRTCAWSVPLSTVSDSKEADVFSCDIRVVQERSNRIPKGHEWIFFRGEVGVKHQCSLDYGQVSY